MFNRYLFSHYGKYFKNYKSDNSNLYGPSFSLPKLKFSVLVKSKDTSLICVGGPAMQATILHALRSSRKICGENITVIGAKSWLFKVHDDWEDKPWGQSKRYLPEPMRKIADKLFKDYPEDMLMNFGMMRNIVLELDNQIKETGITVLEDEIVTFNENKDGVNVVFKNGTEKQIAGNNFRILNAANKPASLENLKSYNSGDLYNFSKQDSNDPVILVGSGANLTWTCRDFAGIRKIIHLQPEFDRPRNDLSDLLTNSILLDQNTTIKRLPYGKVQIEGYDRISKAVVSVVVAEDKVFSALGNVHNNDILGNIDSAKVISVNCGPSRDKLYAAQNLSNRSIKFITDDYRGTKVPEGSLKYSYLKILHQAGHYSVSLPNSLLVFDAWIDSILENAIAHNIDIDNEFLESLRPIAKHLYTDNIPTAEAVSQVLCSQFEKAGRPAQYKDGTKLSQVEFKKLITGSFGEFLQSESDNDNDEFDETQKLTP